MKKVSVLLFFLPVLFHLGCGTTGTRRMYTESSINPKDVTVQRVAIVPNRLPLNLADPEKWRKFNWEVVKDEFEGRGFDVIDYETSVNVFKKSGLPVEDTKSSRDKYSELAQQLDVDAIVIPYYGTFASNKQILVISSMSYISVATFQVYLAGPNDFFSRIDMTGKDTYTVGIISAIGLVCNLLSTVITEEEDVGGGYTSKVPNETLSTIGMVGMIGGMVVDLLMTMQSSNARWEKAFKLAINKGLDLFFQVYPGPGK